MAGGIVALFSIDAFRYGVTFVGNISGDGWNQFWRNSFNLVFYLFVIEIQMLGADQEHIVSFALLDAFQQASGKPHEAACFGGSLHFL